jgi:phosphate-selective porin OprO and OprP
MEISSSRLTAIASLDPGGGPWCTSIRLARELRQSPVLRRRPSLTAELEIPLQEYRNPHKSLGIAATLFAFAGVAFAGGETPAANPSLPSAQQPAAPTAPGPAGPAPSTPATDLRVFWRDGVRFETADKAFSASFGGRLHNDWGWQSADDEVEGDFSDGTRFRRARMHMDGRMYEHMSYKVEFDFAGGSALFREVYLGTSLYEFANIRVGHFKESFGLEQMTSSNNITFVERAVSDVFAPGYNTGVGLGNHTANGRFTWTAGIFRDADDQGRVQESSGYGVTGRVTGLPFYRDKGESLVHLGLSVTHRTGDEMRLRQRPESSFAPQVVDTGVLAVEDQTVLGAEVAWVRGRVSLQGEYVIADVSSDAHDDPSFSGFYGMLSVFLTGERRPYRTSAGTFDRVRPKQNFGQGGGGAWELAARASSLDLDDGPVDGGQVDNLTGGVNWYLNPNMRVMLNYVHSYVESADGDIDSVLLRFQATF